MHKPSNTLQQVKEWLEKHSRFPFETMKKWDALYYIQQLESRLAQVERERDAAVNELPHNCWNCIYHRDTPIEEIDTGGLTIHRYCDADYCYPEEENSSWKWRGVCEENTKEEK